MPLAGRPLVEWSIAAFRAAAGVRSIIIACPPGRMDEVRELDSEVGGKLVAVEGGATRSRSVRNALEVVGTELVAIHDAARPLLTPDLIEAVIAALVADPEADGAIAAAPITDTIKRASLGPEPSSSSSQGMGAYGPQKAAIDVAETVDRGSLWAAQTPQVFRTEALRRALEAYPEDGPPATDEAMPVEAAGGRVLIHPSPPENLKVTTPLDLRIAELRLADRVP